MRVDTEKTYRVSVADLKKILGIPVDETVRTVNNGAVMASGAVEIVTITRCEEVKLSCQ